MNVEAKLIRVSIDLTPEEYEKLKADIQRLVKLAAESPYGDMQENDVLVNYPYLYQLLTVLKVTPWVGFTILIYSHAQKRFRPNPQNSDKGPAKVRNLHGQNI